MQRLSDRARSGTASIQELDQLTTAVTSLATAEATLATGLTALAAAATAELEPAARTALASIQGNQNRGVPIKYLAASRTEAEWVALRNALAANRTLGRWSEEPDGATSALLSTADSQAAAVQANLNSLLGGVAGEFEQFGG